MVESVCGEEGGDDTGVGLEFFGEDLAKDFSKWGFGGFLGEDGRGACVFFDMFCEKFDLSGFSTAVYAFEGEKVSLFHGIAPLFVIILYC